MVSGGTANLLAQERLARQSMEILTQIDENKVQTASDRNVSEYTVHPTVHFMGLLSCRPVRMAMLLPNVIQMGQGPLGQFSVGER